MPLPTKVSEAVRKLNPHLYPVGGLHPNVPQPEAALERETPKETRSRPQVVRGGLKLRVTIIGFRRRILDSDNYIAGQKPLRDAIAHFFGLDDADRFIEWEYGQQRTNGREGTAVRVEVL